MGEAATVIDGNAELATAQELFDESMLDLRPGVVELVRERSFVAQAKKAYVHTGKITVKRLLNDEELAELVVGGLLLKMSARLIGKRAGISPRSVRACAKAMEDRGELAPVRIRIQEKLDQVIESGLDYWQEGIDTGAIHPGQIPIPTLAALDKRAGMDGMGGALVPVANGEHTLDQVRAAFVALRQRASQADAGARNLLPAKDAAILDTAQDTASASVTVPTLVPASAPSALGGMAGGGIETVPPVTIPDGKSPPNSAS